jgi:hypothetical protein
MGGPGCCSSQPTSPREGLSFRPGVKPGEEPSVAGIEYGPIRLLGPRNRPTGYEPIWVSKYWPFASRRFLRRFLSPMSSLLRH